MYYTYTYSKLDGTVFYVGKGKNGRAFSSSDRPKYFIQHALEQDGIVIRIIKRFETEAEAFAHEMELIRSYREQGVFLINRTDGGPGVNGYVQPEELRARKREQLTGYQHKKVQCPHCGFVGGATTTKRWHFDKCRGLKIYKARATLNGRRIFLGNHPTKEAADEATKAFYAQNGRGKPMAIVEST
jgi:hypothetical protein